jgi:RimJ/RimL family protein N-acetyltransferase
VINNYQILQNLLIKDKPVKSDAIIWLQGDRYVRGKRVLKIYKSGLTKLIVISGNNVLIGLDTRPGENNISLTDMKKYLIKKGVNNGDIIVDSKSLNTKEQAINVIKMARQKRWKKITLVSSAYNQPRAFLSFVRATQIIGYKVEIVNQCVNMCENTVASRQIMINRDLIIKEEAKINNYQLKGDVASYKEGFDYLKIDFGKKKLKFRLATIKDSDILLKWRNDPETRKNSLNTEMIKEREHIQWLISTLGDSNKKIYIVEYKKHSVGTIHTVKSDKVTELSWTVASEVRGQGIGKQMVSAFVNKVKGSIVAEIKEGNEASKKIAEYAGMKFKYRKNEILYYQ